MKYDNQTYNTNSRREANPAKLPPNSRIVANHFLDAIIEPVHPKGPRDGDTFEEDQEQQTETRHSVRIENLEHVHTTLKTKDRDIEILCFCHNKVSLLYYRIMHSIFRSNHTMISSFECIKMPITTYLRYTRQANQIRNETNNCNEDFLPSSQQFRPFVDNGRDEAFHSTKLTVQTDEEKHKEEEA